MTCCVCGTPVKLLDGGRRLKNFKLKVPEDKKELKVCSKCSPLLYRLNDMIELSYKDFSKETSISIMSYYKKAIHSKKTMILEKCPLTWLRDEIARTMEIADELCDTYDNYEDYLFTAFDIIEADLELLPSEQISYGFSTFATDGEMLFYMKYGKPLCNNEALTNIEYVKDRKNTVDQLLDNVINAGGLIDVIPIRDIFYFQEKGEIGYSTDVAGGGSKGVSYGGAVIGGLLFGGAGAVVGAMSGNKVEEIKSKSVKHDNRYVVIRYKDASGKTVERKAPYEYFDVFNKLIPEKEYSYIQLNTVSEETVNVAISNIPVEELKALKELLDIGVITQDEFDVKKKQLLGI